MSQEVVYVGFSKPKENKIGSRLIRWWLGKPYSHCYVRWYSETYQLELVYHASSGVVHFISGDNFDKKNETIFAYKLKLKEDARKLLVKKCIDLAGQPYAYLELLKTFVRDFCALVGFKCRFLNSPGYICSELVAEVLQARFGVEFKKPLNEIRPNDIEDYLSRLTSKRYNIYFKDPITYKIFD
jgi:hypothetical protein